MVWRCSTSSGATSRNPRPCWRSAFASQRAAGTVLEGWALAALGQPEPGCEQIQRGLAACRATGAVIDCPYFLALLADACRHADRVAEGRAALEEALSLAHASRSFF